MHSFAVPAPPTELRTVAGGTCVRLAPPRGGGREHGIVPSLGVRPQRIVRWLAVLTLMLPASAAAQTTGSVLGRVVHAETGDALAGATVAVVGSAISAISDEDGRFVLGAVQAGERSLRVDLIGHRPIILEGLLVRSGRPTNVVVRMEEEPLALPGVGVEVQRVRLIEPDVVTTHDLVIGREIRALPVDRVQEVIELAPGVTNGHFRGGRVGQEVHVVDGPELTNQLEASTQGLGLEFAPSSLEEVEVITGGFGAEHGSALSGVVSYVTRRGSTERWESRAALVTDQWAPGSLFHGFTGLSASAGGPLGFLGERTTLFVDVLAQGMLDADPRARGLTCLEPADAEPALAARIAQLDAALRCPYSAHMLPHQRGDKAIMFARVDRPVGPVRTTLSVLRNRTQHELYTQEFRYNGEHQLGQRTTGTLATLAGDWSRQDAGRALHAVGRVALMRLDRYLGAIDPATFDRAEVAGFGLASFEFLGEDFVRGPIEEQLSSGSAVPGYAAPGGVLGSPYGSAGAGIFFTDGTPHIANWSRTDMLAADLEGELLTSTGNAFRTGASTRLFRVESYERVLAHLPGSSPGFARFYPATVSAFADLRVAASDEIHFTAGVRLDGFRSGLGFRADRGDFLSPVIDTDWRLALMPRFGLALPLPGSEGRTAIRFNYGYVSQPPDFRYFLDTTIGDSLRTDIRRQGNPALSFEKGKSYEAGLSQLFGTHIGVGVSVFRKELTQLATGSLALTRTGEAIYSTNDFGTVNGVELTLRGQWRAVSARAGYALQKATGVTAGTDGDSVVLGDAARIERPLAFDQRHAVDAALFFGRAAGSAASDWSAALVAGARSGYPIDRFAAAGDTVLAAAAYLPWTSSIDLRVSRELGRLPLCGACDWRVLFDGRNLLGRDNILALRRDGGRLAPPFAEIQRTADAVPPPGQPIPRESPLYSALLDGNADGVIDAAEFREGRFAAALGRHDPSLFFGEARQVRLGIEVVF